MVTIDSIFIILDDKSIAGYSAGVAWLAQAIKVNLYLVFVTAIVTIE